MKPTVYLIDGSALAYRSYFAFVRRPLVNSKGENTSAVYGVASTLLKLLREEKPDYVGVVFDSKVPTFRHELYPEYKANREKMPEDMRSQFPRILELVDAMGLRVIELQGYEADDVMGTLATRFSGEGFDVVLVSGDKDFCQLVGEGVRLLNPGRGGEEAFWVGGKEVEGRFGVEPDRFLDVLALMGDSSDNIPGVPGIGEKTAARLVRKYGSLEEILDRLPLPEDPRLSEKLLKYSDQARLSRELARIRLDVPVSVETDELKLREGRSERLKALLEELELKRLVSLIFGPAGLDYRWQLVTVDSQVAEFEEKSRSWTRLGVTFCHPSGRQSPPLGVAVAASEEECFYFPIAREGGMFPSAEASLGPLTRLLSNKRVLKCVHDLKAVLHAGSCLDVSGPEPFFDVLIAGYLIDSSADSSLCTLAKRFLELEWESMSSYLGGGKGKVRLEEVPPEKLGRYACGSALVALRLASPLSSSLESAGLARLYNEVEIPLSAVLYEMEALGVVVDAGFLRAMSERLAADIRQVEEGVFRMAGCQFNLNSPAQLSKVLFEDLSLPQVKKTREKRAPSTDEEVLEELAPRHEIARSIIEYRRLSKLKGTYVDAFPRLLCPQSGRLHASFNQAVTATGRLSMSEPNLQNIPARSERGREIRKAFVAGGPGWVLMSADYSQIELRLMAHYSADERLREAFLAGVDVHASTASSLFGVPEDAVPPELRARAKVVNFGIIYGMSPYGLSRELGISTSEAKEFINAYYRTYPGVSEYVRRTIQEGRERGFVSTMLGRRRMLESLRSKNARARAEAERMAINTPIQGSAADMIKLAMVRIARRLSERNLKSRMLLQVHDELLFELPPEETAELRSIVRHEMEHALELSVPVKVEIGVGENWFETH
ncbi:MAG: DNA polymerase I [Candidatus Eisenbacteria bacterium]